MRIKIYLSMLMVLISMPPAFANNLQISNVSLEDRDAVKNTAIVEFDISWDNSWRNTTNYDAAWVVIKVQVGGNWYHGYLDAGGIDPSGTSPGSNSDLEIFVPSDSLKLGNASVGTYYLGAFIYRRGSGTGTVSSTDVRLKLNYNTTDTVVSLVTTDNPTLDDTATIVAKVIGTEMVYIPAGPFYAGDTSSTADFQQGSGDTDPWFIDSDSTIQVNNAASNSFYYTSGGNSGESATGAVFTIPYVFPAGYDAFFCMKYEVTEGQWVEFFNMMTTAQKANRDITGSTGKNSDSVLKRNTVSWSSGDASTSRSDRVVSYLNWPDLTAFLDWMALRPMSELEYEKVARGELMSVSGEYAWGDTSITAGVTFSGSPEDGNTTFTTANANANYNVTTFSQGDDFLGAQYVQGPVRSGIFATGSSTRSSSGAGYYGVMELSGNIYERAVTVGNTTGLTFLPVHGDGYLTGGVCSGSSDGYALEAGWPGLLDMAGVSAAAGSGFKGGSWSRSTSELTVSARTYAALASSTRANDYGGRGVRSVSSPSRSGKCGNSTIEYPEQCDGASLGSCGTCNSTFCLCETFCPG